MIPLFLRELENLFAWLLAASWQASVLALLVLGLQCLLRGRLNPRWSYALWLLVLLRLVLPALPESALSLFQFAPPPPPAFVEPVVEPLFVAAPPQEPQLALPLPKPTTYPFSTYSVLALIWLLGAVALLLLTWQVNRRFARQIAHSPDIGDPALLTLFAQTKAELGIRRSIRLIENGQVQSPAIMGLFRPTLLLPADVRDKFDATELRLIFLHELAHLKRGDVLVQALIALLQILHWFNPVLWFAFRRMRIDREPATDALVLSRTGEEEKERYGLMLIKLLEHFNQRHSLPTLVGILEDKDQFKRRFSLIARFTRGAYGWSVLGVVVIGILAAGCLTKSNRAQETDANLPYALDLKPFYEKVFQDPDGADSSYRGYAGRKIIDGLPFDIAGQIVLFGKSAAERHVDHPDAVSGIKIDRKFDELHLIHAAQWREYDGCPVAIVRLHYADGTHHDFSIRDKFQIDDWNRLLTENDEIVADPDTKIIWRGAGVYKGTGRLFKSMLHNPFPEKKVDTMDIISTHSLMSYTLVAATVAQSDPHRAVTAPLPLYPSRQFDGTLNVHVVDKETGEPIVGAQVDTAWVIQDVSLVGDSVLTGTNGIATVKYPVSDTKDLRVEISKSGYLTCDDNWNNGWDGGSVPTDMTYKLAPARDPSLDASSQTPDAVRKGDAETSVAGALVPQTSAGAVPDEGRLYHALVYQQSGPTAQLAPLPYQFIADIRNTFPDSLGVVSLPASASWATNPVKVVDPAHLVGAHYLYTQGFDSLDALLANFPNGYYIFKITRAQSGAAAKSFDVPVAASSSVTIPETAPAIIGGNWNSGALVLSPSSAVIQYAIMPGVSMSWEVVDRAGDSAGGWGSLTDGMLNLTGLLTPGHTYDGQLRFIRLDNSMTVADPLASQSCVYSTLAASIVQFTITTSVDAESQFPKTDAAANSASPSATETTGKKPMLIRIATKIVQISDADYQAHQSEIDAATQKGDIEPLSHLKSFDLLSEPYVLTKTGERGVLEAVRVLPYPIAFKKDENGKMMPTEFAKKDIGVRIVLTPVMNDGKITVTGALTVTSLQGWKKIDETASQPVFQTDGIPAVSVTLESGQTVALKTQYPEPDADGPTAVQAPNNSTDQTSKALRRLFLFLTATSETPVAETPLATSPKSAPPTTTPPLAPPPFAGTQDQATSQIQIGLKVVEIDEDVYLANQAKIDEAVEKGDLAFCNNLKGVSLLSTPSVTTKPGLKANVAIVREVPYPTQFDAPYEVQSHTANGSSLTYKVPATPTEFATQEVGVKAEITPTLDHDKIILNGKFSVTDFEGFTKSNLVGTGTPSFNTRESFFLEELTDHQEKGVWIPGARFDEQTITDKDATGKALSEKKEIVKKRLLLFLSARQIR